MKREVSILMTLLALGFSALAQQKEYKIAKSTGKIVVSVDAVTIQGYTGKEIILIGQGVRQQPKDARAQGLKEINSSGISDDTGIGVQAVNTNDEVKILQVGNQMPGRLLVKVPQNMKVVVANKSYSTDTIVVQQVMGEIEVNVTSNNLSLKQNSGPMNIKAVGGNIEAQFEDGVKGPISMISIFGFVDVALPAKTKANLQLSSNFGKIYSDDNLNMVIQKPIEEKEDEKVWNLINSLPSDSKLTSVIVDGKALNITTNTNNSATSSTTGTTNVKGTGVSTTASGQKNGTGGIAITANGRFTSTSAYRWNGTGKAQHIKGSINGGGTDIILQSSNNNVYLRNQ